MTSPITVLIVNYGSSEYIRRLLKTIPPAYSVVIVDNYSGENERLHIDGLKSEQVRVLHNINSGFAGGVNAGLREIPPNNYVLVSNPDVEFEVGSIPKLVEASEKHSLDLASPAILQDRTEKIWFIGGKVNYFSFSVVHFRYGETFRCSHEVIPSDFISGCVVLLSPRARKLITPLDETLFMYYEDVLMSIAARTHSLKTGVVAESIALHDEGGTSKGNSPGRSNLYYYYQARNRILAARSTSIFGGASGLVMTPYVCGLTLLRMMRTETAVIERARYMLLGAWDGIMKRAGPSPRLSI